jgi:hypothetical protein
MNKLKQDLLNEIARLRKRQQSLMDQCEWLKNDISLIERVAKRMLAEPLDENMPADH